MKEEEIKSGKIYKMRDKYIKHTKSDNLIYVEILMVNDEEKIEFKKLNDRSFYKQNLSLYNFHRLYEESSIEDWLDYNKQKEEEESKNK